MRMHGCGPRWNGAHTLGVMMMTGRHGGWGKGWGSGSGSDWGQDWSGRRSRGGPRNRVFGSGELRLVLLKLIADQPRHGYELIKAVEELTGGSYAPSPGVVYPTLSLLTDEGAVAEQADAAARKVYKATEQGQAELAERAEEVEALLARLKAMGEGEENHRAPPIARAVGNLFSALRHRTATGEFDRETMHQIAEILDEAARKIERL